jgi:tight adherence protein B
VKALAAIGIGKEPQPWAYCLLTGFVAFAIAGLYFRSIFLLLGGAVLIYRSVLPLIMAQKEGRRMKKLRQETIQWLEELIMALKAGKSLASATGDLARGLMVERGYDQDIVTAECWKHCLGMLRLHYPVSQVYREMAARLGIAELTSLASLLGTAVHTGANLAQVFIQSADVLREQMESKAALEASLASRRMEGYMLAAAPAVYTAFLRLVTPSFMAPLYTGSGWILALVVFVLQIVGCRLFFQLLIREEADPPEIILAGFQEELALQIQAGLSLPDAWRKAASGWASRAGSIGCVEDKPAAGRGEDVKEGADEGIGSRLDYAARLLAVGTPFGKAMELTLRAKGCDAGTRRMAELLLENYQSGGGSLAVLLSTEAKEARQRCLLNRQARDARRGTLLLFPMILLLLSALLLTAAPALLSI